MPNFLTANISPDGLRDHTAEKSHVLKPYGIVGHAASASLQRTCGSILQRRPLCLASTACSTIAQLRHTKRTMRGFEMPMDLLRFEII
ncbi:MAG: hypothetical protein C1941_03390 [Prosthecochloris sp.]|nr:hypothetical protein [Prosthecochloris sp.]